MSKLELTLAIIKPHIIKNRIALNRIRQIILDNEFQIVRNKRKCLNQKLAKAFYNEHNGKFFYERLVSFMSSGPSDVYILTKFDAIKCWRGLLGPTKVYRTIISHPESIRGKFGISDTRNVGHGSDSIETAKKEINFFFPDFDISQWYDVEETYFRNKNTRFLIDKFIHVPNCV